MLEVRDLRLALPDLSHRPLFGPPPVIAILRGIDLDLAPGEALGVVGESGSGKTSLGRTLMRLYRPTGGSIRFEGADITSLDERELRPLRARMQMIFQDPQSSLNPRRRVGDIVAAPLLALGRASNRREGLARARDLLARVGLPPGYVDRYPHELSGGERQRVGIARALAPDPALIVADEIVSGLDVSSQARILGLLGDLRRELGLALVFISHDLSVVRLVCDRVLVMLGGEVVEAGPCERIFAAPRHRYTRRLIDAVPLPDVEPEWIARARVDSEDPQGQGEIPGMNIKGCVALVTGANRGIGAAWVEGLLAAGAARVYATAREDASLPGMERDGVETFRLDTTNPADVSAAAARCGNVTLLVNNAGVNFSSPLLGSETLDNARREMEVNYFGTAEMIRAFAPVLGGNGGGAILNMLSVLARVSLPLMGSLCASKAAGLSLTQAARAQLAGQGTLVVAVMPGAVDTRMTENFPPPKMAPADVVAAGLEAVEAGTEDIYPGDMAEGVSAGLAGDPKAVEKEFAGYLP